MFLCLFFFFYHFDDDNSFLLVPAIFSFSLIISIAISHLLYIDKKLINMLIFVNDPYFLLKRALFNIQLMTSSLLSF